VSSIVRVSILTIPEGRIDEAAEAMRQAEEELKGILKLKGFAPISLALIALGCS